MSLVEQIKRDKMLATKSGDKVKSVILATLLGEVDRIKPTIVDGVKTVKVESVITTIKKMVENNKITNTTDENIHLECYLPKMLSDDETEAIVSQIIEDVSATSMKDMGRVMGVISSTYSTTIDGRLASNITKERLTNGK